MKNPLLIPGTRDTSALNAYKLALWECQQERDKFGRVADLLKARNYELLDRDVKLTIQRDELLEALREIVTSHGMNNTDHDRFSKLIAECEGGNEQKG